MNRKTVSLAQCQTPLVLALDVGSSSVRCGVYDGRARAVAGLEARLPTGLEPGRDGSATLDPEALLETLFRCLDTVMHRIGAAGGKIEGVGCCSLVANLMGLDAAGRPLTSLWTYADTTSGDQAECLAAQLDQEAVRQRVGCYFHPSYWPSQLLFFRERHPTVFQSVRKWSTIGQYLEQTLFGDAHACAMTYSVASWTGLLDRQTLQWDKSLLDHLALDQAVMPELKDLHAGRTGLLPEFGRRWPHLADIPWFPAIGDGAAANLGSAESGADHTIVVTLGTTSAVRTITRNPIPHIPDGLWCYRVDRERSLPGGALTEGGNIRAYLLETLRVEDPDTLEQAVAGMRPDAHGLTLLPFFAGERSPGWRGKAKATLNGWSLATSPADILRAAMEAVTLRLGLVFERLLGLLPAADADAVPVVAGGGALSASDTWTQMLADVLGREVKRSSWDETSALGVARLVLERLGRPPVVDDQRGEIFRPDMTAYRVYQEALDRQVRLYHTLKP
jgi:gluconokinase